MWISLHSQMPPGALQALLGVDLAGHSVKCFPGAIENPVSSQDSELEEKGAMA